MAKLSDKLIVEFATAVTGDTKEKRDSFVYGTVASATEDGVSVIFDGAESATPVSTTVDVAAGHRVLMLIKNHTATVVSNITSPTVNGVTFTTFKNGVMANFDGITAKYADLGGFISVADDTEHEGKTSAAGGHAHRTSLYVHNSDDTYEYEAGLKGDARDSAYVAFYIKRMPKGQAWSSSSYMFYVNNSGKLYAQNAVIKGEIEATKFKAIWTGSTITATELKAEMTAGGLDVTSDYTSLGHFHLRLNPENTTWIKSTNMQANASHVRINSTGIYVGTAYSQEGIQITTSGHRIYASGEIQSGSNIKCISESTGAYTNIHANSVDVFIEGTESDGRTGRFTSSAAGNIGLYDVDNSNYIIYSNSSFEVHTNHKFYCQGQADTTERMPIGSSNTSNQKVGWLGCTATATLSIRGQWNANSWGTKTVAVSSSDVRLKRDISDTKVKALDVLSKIRMREFTWKEDDVFQPLGVIADELEKIDPLFVVGGGEDENGDPIYKSINMLYLLGYCVKAIQELKGDHDDGR